MIMPQGGELFALAKSDRAQVAPDINSPTSVFQKQILTILRE